MVRNNEDDQTLAAEKLASKSMFFNKSQYLMNGTLKDTKRITEEDPKDGEDNYEQAENHSFEV